MSQANDYVFWKKPWHKWLVAVATILQAIGLYLKYRTFRTSAGLK